VDTAQGRQVEAEVVGFSGDKLFLMPTGDIRGIMPGARVIPTRSVTSVAVGDELLAGCWTAPGGLWTRSASCAAAIAYR